MNYKSIILKNNKKFIYSITLNCPSNGNALNNRMINELTHALKELSKQKKCRVIIIESSSKIFCAGADLNELKEMQKNNYSKNLNDSKKLMSLFKIILSIEKLVIAKVNGAAIAGGCGLATACDIIFGSEKSKFGYSEVNIGFVPALVSTYLPKRINSAIAKELLLTGKILNFQEAREVNLINYCVDAKKIDTNVNEYADKFIQNSSPQSVMEIKKMLFNFYEIEEKMNIACEINAKSRKNTDCIKGIDRFLKKEKNNWN